MTRDRWRPIAPERLPDLITGIVSARVAAGEGLQCVALDGADSTAPHELAESLLEPLRALGHDAVHVRASSFWRDASLRFEYGREDVESYLGWLDAPALRREVLDPAHHQGQYLPSLRDPASNRSTREQRRPIDPNGVVVVSGEFLLGLGLPFDVAVHLCASSATLARRVPDELAWTVPAHTQYAAEVRPAEIADVVIRVDDPRHPAARW